MSAAAQLDATLLRLALRDALKAPSAHKFSHGDSRCAARR
jgi:hypothetical protein